MLEKTGYTVRIVFKQHRTFVELLDAFLRSDGVDFASHDLAPVNWLQQEGECLTLAAALAVGLTPEAAESLRDNMPPVRMSGARILGRSYRQISGLMKLSMCPRFTLDFQPNTAWIFHSENGTNPHAMLISLHEDGRVAIYHGRCRVSVAWTTFSSWLHESTDFKTHIFYGLTNPGEYGENDALLDVVARAGNGETNAHSPPPSRRRHEPAFTLAFPPRVPPVSSSLPPWLRMDGPSLTGSAGFPARVVPQRTPPPTALLSPPVDWRERPTDCVRGLVVPSVSLTTMSR